jgi:hypothetical protein
MDQMELATLVSRLRYFQQQYYRSRSSWTLEQCRKYEKLVDAYLDTLSDKMKIENPENHKKFITVTIKSKI